MDEKLTAHTVQPPGGIWSRMSERADDTILLAAVAFVFCIIKTLVQPSTRNLRYYLTMFFVSVPVGTLAGRAAHEAGLSDSGCLTATAIASLLAQDLIIAVLKHSGLIERVIQWLADKWLK